MGGQNELDRIMRQAKSQGATVVYDGNALRICSQSALDCFYHRQDRSLGERRTRNYQHQTGEKT